MALLPLVEPSAATGRVKEIFEGPLKGKGFNIFKSMANAPAAMEAYLGLAVAVGHGTLTPVERELIQLAIGEANHCEYCAAAHTAVSRGLGMSDAVILEARRGKMSDPKQGALVRFALALHERKGYVTESDVAAFTAGGYRKEQIPEVIAVYALAVYTNYFNHANQTAVDFPAAPRV
ncbi:MAG: carboxymuconolactone decarboxylase family protein [Phycisphaerales bacterium]|nr:carboxymuconolactone decarboxylase family protein [Phycisphaerales bacterium]